MKYSPGLPTENHNISDHSIVGKSFELIATLLVIATLMILTAGSLVDFIVRFAPIEFGRYLGNTIYDAQVVRMCEELDVSDEQKRVDRVFAKLKANLDEDSEYLQAVVVANKTVENAFALPGGRIIITSALLKLLESDRELAMILGHELGHQINRDTLRMFGKSLIVSFGLWLISGDNSIQQAGKLATLGFSRNQETEADLFALSLLRKTYGSVEGALGAYKVLTTIAKRHGEDSLFYTEMFSTHPHSADRLSLLKETIKKHQ